MTIEPRSRIYPWTGFRLGTVFQLSQTGQNWVGSAFYNFPGGEAGSFPLALTVVGGKLYGVAEYGGASGNGAVFEITP
jgi:uncharacterized repeat protein (TIGR03803 family)